MRAKEADREKQRLLGASLLQLADGPIRHLGVRHRLIGCLERMGAEHLSASAQATAERTFADDARDAVFDEIVGADLRRDLRERAREKVVPRLRFIFAAVDPLQAVENLSGARGTPAMRAEMLREHDSLRERTGAAIGSRAPG